MRVAARCRFVVGIPLFGTGVGIGVACLLATGATAQSALRGWGDSGRFATDAYALPAATIVALGDAAAVLRADGRIYVHGYTDLADPPPLPAGATCLQLVIGGNGGYEPDAGFALLSNGAIFSWGEATMAPPPLPPGTGWVQVSASDDHAVALRSDGAVLAWGDNSAGQLTLPTVPPGSSVLQVHAGYACTLLRLANGSILSCGGVPLNAVPAPPPGVTYTGLWGGVAHAIASRSDGTYVGWGANDDGQANVPAPPPGVTYTMMGLGGAHTMALRSDGALVGWGDDSFGQRTPPALPPNAVIAQIACGSYHTALRLADGSVVTFGYETFARPVPSLPVGERWVDVSAGAPHLGLTSGGAIVSLGRANHSLPALLPGTHWTSVIAGLGHSLAIRSDGRALAWGDNSLGQCAIPPLPPGMTYVAADAALVRTVLLRSDGVAVECGNQGVATLPPQPPGTAYESIACNEHGTILRRSDGAVVVFGVIEPTQGVVPPLPPGLQYVEVAISTWMCAALRSDGQIAVWGLLPHLPLPALPPGVVYVQVDGGWDQLVARRSDGRVVAASARTGDPIATPPTLASGESFVSVSNAGNEAVALVGPTCSYVTFATGCAGSRPASRLVPRDTPRIGEPFALTLFDLPRDAALLVFGWSRIAPVPLAPLGMPGCAQQISVDAVVAVAGQGAQARLGFLVPDNLALVGLSFANQAIVFDPTANPAGAVVSDAAQGIIGRR